MEITFKTVMKVTTKKGDEYNVVVDHPKGTPEKPLTKEEFLECFRDYISYGVNALPDENISAIISTVGKLEQLEDVRGLIALLAPRSKE